MDVPQDNSDYCLSLTQDLTSESVSFEEILNPNCLRFLWHNKVGPKSKNYVLWSSKWKIERKKEKFPLRYVLKVPLHALSKGAETFSFLCLSYYKNGLKEIEVLRERCERTSYTPQLTTAPNLACSQLWRSWKYLKL